MTNALVPSQQAKKCAKTVVAPPPKQIKKVQLPSHFQFFNDTNTTDDQASETWRKGFTVTFQAYQKVINVLTLKPRLL
jgi:hypothetical protein